MNASRRSCGFSLIEVILAVGIFAGSIAVILALVAALSRQAAESGDFLVAQRLPEAVSVELSRLAANDFESLATQIPVMGAPLDNGLALVATRDSPGVHSLNYLPRASRPAVEEQYFLVECWRFPTEPLAFSNQKALLALHVRVSWPYRLPGMPGLVPVADRQQLSFTASLNR